MHVSRVNSRVTERLCELPDVGKVDTKYQGGFAIVCTAIVRGCGYLTPEAGAPDLSSQVCTTNEFKVSVLIT